jgi:hypothetical protein
MLVGTNGGVAGLPSERSVPAWISRASRENSALIGCPARGAAYHKMLQYILWTH